MQCEQCREAISAGLDGEDEPGESVAVDAHLANCADCRAFLDAAARATRLARTRRVGAGPDLIPALLQVWDSVEHRPLDDHPEYLTNEGASSIAARPKCWPTVVRAALAAVAIGQFALAVSAVAVTDADHGMELDGASMTHFAHESAAWNLALGVAFAWVATTRARPAAALVPAIAAFVGLLTALSVPDLLAGRVDPSRLSSHALVVAGLILLVVHRALTRDGGDGSTHRSVPPSGTPESPPTPAPGGAADGRRVAGWGLEPTARRVA